MIQNNNLSVLPWYTSIEQQNHRKSYAYGNIYPLIAPAGHLLPFQIQRPNRANTVADIVVNLYKYDGQLVTDISSAIKQTSNITIVPFSGFDNIVFYPITAIGTTIAEGAHYMTLFDGEQTWFSEVFTVVEERDISTYLKIEWYDVDNAYFDAGAIVYHNPTFHNILYLQTELGKPEYQFTEEGETRDGYFFPEKQISEKTYRCTALAPEYLCDVMRLIRMSDYIKITDKYGREYDCDTFLITPKWQEQGNLASIEIEFETDTVVKKIGRCISRVRGDFNEDYNADFNNQ